MDRELLYRIAYKRVVERKSLRRIGEEEDPRLSKDTIARRLKTAKAEGIIEEILNQQMCSQPSSEFEEDEIAEIVDEELMAKQEVETKLELEVKQLEAKRELDKRICSLLNAKYSNNYGLRCKLFKDPTEMWNFIQTILSVKNPQLLDEFKREAYSKNFTKMVSISFNPYFQRVSYENKYHSLDKYIESTTRELVDGWKSRRALSKK